MNEYWFFAYGKRIYLKAFCLCVYVCEKEEFYVGGLKIITHPQKKKKKNGIFRSIHEKHILAMVGHVFSSGFIVESRRDRASKITPQIERKRKIVTECTWRIFFLSCVNIVY